ncbi:MAG: RnfABCDGE type electron transport complex subunit D [Spirochaetales bacterium]|nr:RnfABCDGE type electron transport complex subunit D [Spirochaetales bacterium]
MMKSEKRSITSASAPYIAEGAGIRTVMWTVSACLVPALAWGLAVFGARAILVVATALAGAVLTELAANAIRGKVTVGDGSAFLTGLVIGMSLPPAAPVYVPLCASVFAVAVVKHASGGLGANWMNPAMAGRVFALLSFPAAMSAWIAPATIAEGAGPSFDALSGATPLSVVKTTVSSIGAGAASQEAAASALRSLGGPAALMAVHHYPVTAFDGQLSKWLGGLFGVNVRPGYFDLFFGNTAGSIGEISVFLLLVGAAVLLARKIISWEIPAALLGTFALLTWVFGGVPFATGLFQGDVLFHLFSGGIVFCAFFIATDYVSGPLTRPGKIVFGAGVGLIAFLIRAAGILPEGASVAIIVMNMFVPLIDRFLRPKRTVIAREKTT